jgi:hypothetical protein
MERERNTQKAAFGGFFRSLRGRVDDLAVSRYDFQVLFAPTER